MTETTEKVPGWVEPLSKGSAYVLVGVIAVLWATPWLYHRNLIDGIANVGLLGLGYISIVGGSAMLLIAAAYPVIYFVRWRRKGKGHGSAR